MKTQVSDTTESKKSKNSMKTHVSGTPYNKNKCFSYGFQVFTRKRGHVDTRTRGHVDTWTYIDPQQQVAAMAT